MKLATYRNHRRDGCLMLVSRDLRRARPAAPFAATLQEALDDWERIAPLLQQASAEFDLAHEGEPFDAARCLAPLPRAYQWLDGSAYLNHVELVRRARGAELPSSLYTDPLMYQGCSDGFLPPNAPLPLADADWGLDFEAEVAVICGDVPAGASTEVCGAAIRLLTLVNDVSLRNLIPAELAKGFGFLQSKPRSSMAPLALTPDELGDAWRDGKLHLPLRVEYNRQCCGQPNAGDDMQFSFAQLLAHAARTRPLAAGTVLGGGTVSNRDRSLGYCCLVEARTLETLETGGARTPYMRVGDSLRIEMRDGSGHSLFGAIEQQVVAP
jgi:fumarylacetoacetate (FAA) hydrolase